MTHIMHISILATGLYSTEYMEQLHLYAFAYVEHYVSSMLKTYTNVFHSWQESWSK